MDNTSSPPERKRNGRSGKAPAFQFYPADFLMDEDVAMMSLTERGAYITLLSFNWREGSLPATEQDLARLLRCSVMVLRQLWKRVGVKFKPHPDLPGRLVNPRAERDRCAYAEWVQKKHQAGVQGGRKSAELRRQRQATVQQPSTSSSASASASAKEVVVPPSTRETSRKGTHCAPDGAPLAPFEDFWACYPNKRDKKRAMKAWLRLHPTIDQLETMLSAIKTQKQSDQWRRGIIPHAATWINGDRWADEIPLGFDEETYDSFLRGGEGHD